jgi:hypothetical protein
MRERVWGSPDVGRAPGCVRTQGTLPGSIWKRGMWRGVATQVRTHRTHGTQEMRRLRQDATPTDQTQGPFLLMLFPFVSVSQIVTKQGRFHMTHTYES